MMTDYGVAPASDESLDAALAMFEASVGLPVRTPPPRTAARVSGTHDAAQAVAAVTAAREEPATPKAYEDTEAGDSLALCERLFSPRVVSPPSPQPRGNSGYRAASAEDTETQAAFELDEAARLPELGWALRPKPTEVSLGADASAEEAEDTGADVRPPLPSPAAGSARKSGSVKRADRQRAEAAKVKGAAGEATPARAAAPLGARSSTPPTAPAEPAPPLLSRSGRPISRTARGTMFVLDSEDEEEEVGAPPAGAPPRAPLPPRAPPAPAPPPAAPAAPRAPKRAHESTVDEAAFQQLRCSVEDWELLRGKKQKKNSCGKCGTSKTPQWRTGPLGPQTLCNACGVRYSVDSRAFRALQAAREE